MLQLGVDEAGRGPVAGPMVICGLIGEPAQLRSIGVKDSKALTPARRNELYAELIRTFQYRVEIIEPDEIDNAVETGGLNYLELTHISSIIKHFSPAPAIVDCPDVNEMRFQSMLITHSGARNVIARHRADIYFEAVSAASIIAKVIRDRHMLNISRMEGEDVGSGYPSDSLTMSYIQRYLNSRGVLPPWVRKSWKPVKDMISISKVKSFDEFRNIND